MKKIESMLPDAKIRRRLLTGAGFGIVSLLSIFKFRLFPKKNAVISCLPPVGKTETIKVLSQDGQLLEVDVSGIKQPKRKISDEELKNWIRKDKI